MVEFNRGLDFPPPINSENVMFKSILLSEAQARELVLPKINGVTAARISLFLEDSYPASVKHSATDYAYSLNVSSNLTLNQGTFRVELVGKSHSPHHDYNSAFISQQASPYDRKDRTDFEFDLDWLLGNGCVKAVLQGIENEVYLISYYVGRDTHKSEQLAPRLKLLNDLKFYLLDKHGETNAI